MRCATVACQPAGALDALLAQESKLVLVLVTGSTSQFRINTSTLGIRSKRTTKEENVGFRPVKNKQKSNAHRGENRHESSHAQQCQISMARNKHSPMNRVMLPSTALLNSDATPFRLRQETRLREGLGQLLGKNDMSV